MAGSPIGVGFVGMGAVAEQHRRALDEIPAARLVAGCGPTDQDLQRARAWGLRAYREAGELVADPDVEVVFVLSPMELHCAHAIQALQAGRPVLVEKPVSGSVDDIILLRAEAERAALPCVPAHNYIYNPAVRQAHQLLEAGALGTVCMTWIMYAIHHAEEVAAHYPGVLQQILPHHLYTLLYLHGMPLRLSAMSGRRHYQNLEQEDQVAIQLELADGSQAHLFATFAADDRTSQPWTFMIKILGTGGGFNHSWRDVVTAGSLGTHAERFGAYEDSYRREDEHFLLRALRGEPAPSTLTDAARVQQMVDAAARSIATGRTVELGGGTEHPVETAADPGPR